jgi:hypothetical protein
MFELTKELLGKYIFFTWSLSRNQIYKTSRIAKLLK